MNLFLCGQLLYKFVRSFVRSFQGSNDIIPLLWLWLCCRLSCSPGPPASFFLFDRRHIIGEKKQRRRYDARRGIHGRQQDRTDDGSRFSMIFSFVRVRRYCYKYFGCTVHVQKIMIHDDNLILLSSKIIII